MRQAPTSGGHGTAGADIPANAASFGRHLRAANKAPATIHAYTDAVARFDASLEDHGMPRSVAAIRRGMSSRSSRTSSPASSRPAPPTATGHSSSSSDGWSMRARSKSRP
jgi:hypothetical protein